MHSRLDAILYICHHRLVNGYSSHSQISQVWCQVEEELRVKDVRDKSSKTSEVSSAGFSRLGIRARHDLPVLHGDPSVGGLGDFVAMRHDHHGEVAPAADLVE